MLQKYKKKEILTLVHQKLFKGYMKKEEKTLDNSFHEAIITLISLQEIKLPMKFYNEKQHKDSQKSNNPNLPNIKQMIQHDQVGFVSLTKSWLNV